MIGTVKWFNEKKGFGFIESNGEDYFLHFSSLGGPGFKTIHEGAKVEFMPKKGLKGMEATEVKIL